ncbi:NUDIX hydrolase [Brasilonema sp. UFV-L1]|uniref:NUDIX hydrolase n=1 Tax=Brasilonema sp. UFV-L1 TaxID=2234130 RepID=UPI00145DBBD3|nr:NUDIX hydrolase [Brasilonema sp. UFV-L1]NMG05433.1 ADP-ribose pyrophosphatase [Brasilonema sp. UFV-L1]
MSYEWLEWAQQLQAIAQNGLTYSENPFDLERYQQLRQIAAQIMATHSNTEFSYILDLFNSQVGYATPKVDVRAAVFHFDKILLVQEKEDRCWTLPGGWADIGESPSQAIVREVYEESGYHTQVVKLLAVYDRNHSRHGHPPMAHHVYKLFFLCELMGGMPTRSLETEDVAFFGELEIPKLSLTRVVPSQMTRLFEHYRNPNLQTDFD